MKKILLLTLLCGITLNLPAQGKNPNRRAKQMPVRKDFVNDYAPTNPNPGLSATAKAKNANASLVFLGKAGNIYYALLEEQQCMTYDPAANLLQMIHRADPETYPEANDNGAIVSTQSLDQGATWDYTMLLPGDGQEYTRYPQGFIYNAAQNTDPEDVITGACGPAHSGGTWNANFFVSGLNTDPFKGYASFYDMNCLPEYLRYGMAATDDGFVYALSGCFESDNSGFTRFDMNTYRGKYTGDHIEIGLDYPTTADIDFVGSVDALAPTTYWWGKFSTAWAQDGSIGYIFGEGLLNDFAGQSGFNPIVWKSTDHGVTWTLLTEGMNMVDFPGLEDVLVQSDDGHYIPLFKGGVAGTVDVNGDLQFFGECYSGSTMNVDNCYIPAENDDNYRLMNVTINPETGITGFKFITNFLSFDVEDDSPYAYAAGANGIGWNHRIQTSRSRDGFYYFVVWGDTPNAEYYYEGENAHPDLFAWGQSLDPNYYTWNTSPVQLTEEGYYWFHYVSDIVIPEGGPVFKIPVTQTVNQLEMLVNTDLDPVTISFVDELIYDFPISYSGATGVEEVENKVNLKAGQNQPNPFSGISTVSVTLDRKAGLSLEVYNTLGQRVYSMEKGVVSAGSYDFRLDAGNFTPGIYYYMVKAGGAKVCKKMIVK